MKIKIFSFYLSVSAGLFATMRICYVVLLLLCIGLMYTVQANDNTTVSSTTTTVHDHSATSQTKENGSEHSEATLVTLAITFVTVFILQSKD